MPDLVLRCLDPWQQIIRRLGLEWVSALLSTVSHYVNNSPRTTLLIYLSGLGGLIGMCRLFSKDNRGDQIVHQALQLQVYCSLPTSYGGGQ